MMLEALAVSLITIVPPSPSWVGFGSVGSTQITYLPPGLRPISLINLGDDNSTIYLFLGAIPDNATIVADPAFLLAFHKRPAVAKKLDDFRDLPADWAGTGTIAPSQDTIASAKALLSSLAILAPQPSVSPSSDGEIGFAWTVGKKQIESILAPDGKLVWFWTEGKRVFPGGETDFNGSFPDDLVNALNG